MERSPGENPGAPLRASRFTCKWRSPPGRPALQLLEHERVVATLQSRRSEPGPRGPAGASNPRRRQRVRRRIRAPWRPRRGSQLPLRLSASTRPCWTLAAFVSLMMISPRSSVDDSSRMAMWLIHGSPSCCQRHRSLGEQPHGGCCDGGEFAGSDNGRGVAVLALLLSKLLLSVRPIGAVTKRCWKPSCSTVLRFFVGSGPVSRTGLYG